MKRAAVTCLMVAFFVGSVFSQTVNICGLVTDQSGNPLTHTVVRLGQTTFDNGYGQAPYLVTTDKNGHYQLGSGNCNVNVVPKSPLVRGDAFAQPVYVGGKVLFSLTQSDALVRMSIYDLTGRCVRNVLNKSLSKGNYSMSIDTRGISSQFYLLRVTINGAASVLKLQPVSHLLGGTVVQSTPGFETRLEKLAAVTDTLHATEPGYTIGVTPITALTGQYNFTLTKNNTWTGDKTAFWGDTSTYPKTFQYIILNRTNGAFPDTKIYWSHEQGGAKVQLSQQSVRPIVSERFYLYVDPTDSNSRYFDFLEVNAGGGSWNGNSTRVDGWRLPIAFRLHTSTGIDTVMGDDYELFYQTRQSKFDEYKNEVPKEFTGLATHDFANIWAPHVCPVNYFNTGGPYVDYFTRYQDSASVHYVKNPGWAADPGAYPTVPTAWDIFACAGPNPSMGASPDWSAAINRHVATLPQGVEYANWRTNDTAAYYQDAPCNYFSKWCHRRSINNYCYGFPYDDDGGHQSFMGIGNVQWIAVAIGW